MPTGIGSFDRTLDGGIPVKSVSLIYGAASTGKTTLMLQASCNASSLGFKVLYIDVDRSFSPERFYQIAGSSNKRLSRNITIFQPENFKEQTNIIENLENYLNPNIILVIVDSITTLYRVAPFTLEGRFSLNRELTRQLAYLNSMAMNHCIAVLISSQVHVRLDERFRSIEPVAKRTLMHWSNNVIALKNTNNSEIKEIHVERASGKEVSITFKVKMHQEGLTELRID